jgi:hypothetical protein
MSLANYQPIHKAFDACSSPQHDSNAAGARIATANGFAETRFTD